MAGSARTPEDGPNIFRGATSVGRPPIGTMLRIITRDVDDGSLMEDLVVNAFTPDKRMNTSLAKPKNVDVELFLDDSPKEDQ